MNTTGVSGIRVRYNIRDIDVSAADDAIQQVALQYRIGNTGNFTNIPTAYVADATTGPGIVTLVTPVDITLPAACDNQAQLEIRIITTNAVGNDEWVGIDDIDISTGTSTPVSTIAVAAGVNAAEPSTNGTFTINFSSPTLDPTDFNFAYTGTASFGTDYTVSYSAGSTTSLIATGTFTVPAGTSSVTVTLTPADDSDIEPVENITLTISSPTGGYLLGSDNSSINLADNDVPTPVAANVVINQVYGGGGNSGATFKNDFIELYNNENTPVNLAGWSVQYLNAAGTGNWSVTPLTGIIPPHSFFLIQEATGAGGTTNLPPADVIGTIAMGATAGKVLLSNSTTVQTGANPSGITIMDKVGYASYCYRF